MEGRKNSSVLIFQYLFIILLFFFCSQFKIHNSVMCKSYSLVFEVNRSVTSSLRWRRRRRSTIGTACACICK